MMNNNMNSVPVYDSIEGYEIKEFLAVGGESVVFKGVKKSVGRTYALKVRDRTTLNDFFTFEMQTLSKLEQCSTSKLAGVIPDIYPELMDYLYEKVPNSKKAKCQHMIDLNISFFCIVEDYISGCDLHEFCRGNPARNIKPHTPGINARYDEVVEFQKTLLGWIKQFCEIMINVTEKNNVLHLDIKPDNVMISHETGALTVIDFGKSVMMAEGENHASLNDEFGENVGVFGTNGYAAPECCDAPEYRDRFNIQTTGIIDERSDIFSFGALLWDCINPYESIEIKENIKGYFKRDLFNTPLGYTPEIEAIVMKCTERYPSMRFKNYKELKNAAIDAEKKLLQRDKPNKTIWLVGILCVMSFVLAVSSLFLDTKRDKYTFEIAQKEFLEVAKDYKGYTFDDYKETAEAYIDANKDYHNNSDKPYKEILEHLLDDDGYINKDEYDFLENKCIRNIENKNVQLKKDYVNTIMSHLEKDNKYIKYISERIDINEGLNILKNNGCDGMDIAEAIQKYLTEAQVSYKTLTRFKPDSEYAVALSYLAQKLNDDTDCLNQIIQSLRKEETSKEDISKEELQNKIQNELKKYIRE